MLHPGPRPFRPSSKRWASGEGDAPWPQPSPAVPRAAAAQPQLVRQPLTLESTMVAVAGTEDLRQGFGGLGIKVWGSRV